MVAALPATMRQTLAVPEAEVAAQLEAWYGPPERHYHTLAHVHRLVEQHAILCTTGAVVPGEGGAPDPRTLDAASLVHDAVYVVGRPDNEVESARLAAQVVPRWWPDLDPGPVQRLVRLSAEHGRLDPSTLALWERVWLDLDLAVLGSTWDSYLDYARAVAQEYLPVAGAAAYTAGRAAWIRGVLGGGRPLYHSATLVHLETRALENLRTELAILGDDPTSLLIGHGARVGRGRPQDPAA